MARNDAFLSVLQALIAGQFEDLDRHVLDDTGQIDGRCGIDFHVGVIAQVFSHPAYGKQDTGTRRNGCVRCRGTMDYSIWNSWYSIHSPFLGGGHKTTYFAAATFEAPPLFRLIDTRRLEKQRSNEWLQRNENCAGLGTTNALFAVAQQRLIGSCLESLWTIVTSFQDLYYLYFRKYVYSDIYLQTSKLAQLTNKIVSHKKYIIYYIFVWMLCECVVVFLVALKPYIICTY